MNVATVAFLVCVFAFLMLLPSTKLSVNARQQNRKSVKPPAKETNAFISPLGLKGALRKSKIFTKGDVNANNKVTYENPYKKPKESKEDKNAGEVVKEILSGPTKADASGRIPCGEYGKGLYYDKCGACGGNNSCVDCKGIPWGKSKVDRCGVCAGDNGCVGCDNVSNSGLKFDKCGVCGGDNSKCKDCRGIINGTTFKDQCGICGGDNSTCCGKGGNCGRRGICSISIKGCLCYEGYTGRYCQALTPKCRDAGATHDCRGNGVCKQDTQQCECKSGWYGKYCQIRYCSGHGYYDSRKEKCVCDPGYKGKVCNECKQAEEGKEYVCVQGYPQTDERAFYYIDPSGRHVKSKEEESAATTWQAFPEDIGNSVEWNGKEKKAYSKDNLPHFLTKKAKNTVAKMGSKEIISSLRKIVRFVRMQVPQEEVGRHLLGRSQLSLGEVGGVILPGMSINGTTYGCDCRPASPADTAKTKFSSTTLVDNTESYEEERTEDDKKDQKNSHGSIVDAQRTIWGKDKKKKEEESLRKRRANEPITTNSIRRAAGAILAYEEDVEPTFTLEERTKYRFYVSNVSEVIVGRRYKKFIEVRAPLDGEMAKDELQQLLDHAGENVNVQLDEANAIGAAVDRLKKRDNTEKAVTNVVVAVGISATIVILSGGALLLFIFVKQPTS